MPHAKGILTRAILRTRAIASITLRYKKCTSLFPARYKTASNFALSFPFVCTSATTYLSHSLTFPLGRLRRVKKEITEVIKDTGLTTVKLQHMLTQLV
jgi:hypothetical protein